LAVTEKKAGVVGLYSSILKKLLEYVELRLKYTPGSASFHLHRKH